MPADILTALQELEQRSKREYVSWELLAYAYLGLDNRDKLLSILSAAPKFGIIGRLLLAHDVSFDPLRDDPRFHGILPPRPGARPSAESRR